jgi:hypothetical protein
MRNLSDSDPRLPPLARDRARSLRAAATDLVPHPRLRRDLSRQGEVQT